MLVGCGYSWPRSMQPMSHEVARGILLCTGASMKRREFIVSSVAGSVGSTLAHGSLASASEDAMQPRHATTRKVLIAGGNYNTAFIGYMAKLTGKPRPKLLYLPTANADSPTG